MTRVPLAWLLGLGGSALVLVACDLVDLGANLTAVCLLPTIGAASAIGGRTIGLWVSGIVGFVYAVALLAPFGHLRVGLTHDMLVLALFLLFAFVVGTISDRRRPPPPEPPVVDPTALLSAVSHDLRNPLSTIRAASSDLLNGTHAAEPERQAELLGLVKYESERLDRIVGNLLSVGRAQAGKLEPHLAPESPQQLLDRIVPRLRRMHTQPIDADVDANLPDVLVDEIQIDQVITNLVENAARACPADATITIEARTGDDEVAFAVYDTGPGFGDLDDDPFQPFNSNSGSSGLGLAICKAIVAAHGGTITIDPTPTRPGGCVRFTVPIATDSPPSSRR